MPLFSRLMNFHSLAHLNVQLLLTRSILQPVLKRQPVALDIISLLGHHAQDGQTGLHVNAIYKKLVALVFSRNKYPIINIIDYLEQSGLLMTTMRGVQKEIKTLTRLGYKFVKLVNDLDEYVKSCSDLQDAIKRDFDLDNYIGNKEQRSILRSKGWTQDEIDEYDNLLLCSKHLTSDLISPYEVIDVMFIRYVSVFKNSWQQKCKNYFESYHDG